VAGLRASAAWAEQPETIAMCDFECLGYKPLQLFVPSHKRLRLSHDGHFNDKAVQLGRRYFTNFIIGGSAHAWILPNTSAPEERPL
jgi:hypothetical protein